MPTKGRVPPHLRKYLFKKKGTMAKRKHHRKAAIVRYKTRTKHVTRYRSRQKRHRRRGRHSGGGVNLTHLALAGAGLAYLTGASSPFQVIPQNIQKIPGAKTFGNAATAGLVCLGVNHFKRNKWLRAAGVIGVVLGAVQLGTQGTNFKWVGDAGDDDGFVGDIGDDE